MAFFYNSVTKTFLFAPRETPPFVPGAPDEPSFGLIRDGDLGARDCCCCPCCAVPEGSQIYVCTNDTKKRRCINDGGTPKCNHATCQPDTCCNGACCQGTSCSITADIVCQQLGGVFKGCGTTCGATTCAPPAPAPCSCLAGVSVFASVTATFSEGASCSGTTQSFSGNLVRRLQFADPTWNIEAANANGYFFAVWLVCTGSGWHTYVGHNTQYLCALGQDSGGYTAATSAENPVQGQTVGGVCRLSNGSWTATEENSGWPSPNFGLTLTWSLSFNHV